MTDADGTEELRVGRDPDPRRLRRPGTVVAVALLGLAVAWVTTRLDSGDPSAGPTTATTSSTALTPTTTTITASVGASIVPLPVATALPRPACPAGTFCWTTDTLPQAVTAALRANYPGARVVSSRTITRRDRTTLIGRSIRVVAGPRRIDIVVQPYVMGPDDLGRTNSTTVTRTTLDVSTPGQTVHLVLTEPRTAHPDDLSILRLARDPRLAAQ